jgi:hypothetical protein
MGYLSKFGIDSDVYTLPWAILIAHYWFKCKFSICDQYIYWAVIWGFNYGNFALDEFHWIIVFWFKLAWFKSLIVC